MLQTDKNRLKQDRKIWRKNMKIRERVWFKNKMKLKIKLLKPIRLLLNSLQIHLLLNLRIWREQEKQLKMNGIILMKRDMEFIQKEKLLHLLIKHIWLVQLQQWLLQLQHLDNLQDLILLEDNMKKMMIILGKDMLEIKLMILNGNKN